MIDIENEVGWSSCASTSVSKFEGQHSGAICFSNSDSVATRVAVLQRGAS